MNDFLQFRITEISGQPLACPIINATRLHPPSPLRKGRGIEGERQEGKTT